MREKIRELVYDWQKDGDPTQESQCCLYYTIEWGDYKENAHPTSPIPFHLYSLQPACFSSVALFAYKSNDSVCINF